MCTDNLTKKIPSRKKDRLLLFSSLNTSQREPEQELQEDRGRAKTTVLRTHGSFVGRCQEITC